MQDELDTRRFVCQNGIGGCIQQCGIIGHVDKTGKLVKVTGNPDSLVSRGYICTDRVPKIPDLLYSEWQLKHPLKRAGNRGENKWQQISWDQALDEISMKLRELTAQYGPETLAIAEGTYRSDAYWARSRFLNLFGNPSNVVGPGTICFTHLIGLHYCLFGDPMPLSDLIEANCIVNPGRDFNASMPLSGTYLQARMKRKDKPPPTMIVLDPRATDAVRDADLWLQPRPGTDGVIFMSWLNVVVNDKLYDREFVEKWTNAPLLVIEGKNKILRERDVDSRGSQDRFVAWNTATSSPAIWNPDTYTYVPEDAKPALEGSFEIQLVDGGRVQCKPIWQLLLERVREYPPEKAEEISWVPARKIREGARIYATTKPGTIQWCVSQDQQGVNSINIEFAKCILRMLTGNIDVAGGEVLKGPGPRQGGKMAVRDSMLQMDEAITPEQQKKQIGYDRFKLMTWAAWEKIDKHFRKRWGIPYCMSGHNHLSPAPMVWRAILDSKPYPVRAMITWTANPTVWSPNTKIVYDALKSPNLELHVVLEHVMTPTAQLADYVLPVASKAERAWASTWEDFVADMIIGEKAIEPMAERRTDYYFWRELGIRMGQDEKTYWPWKTEEEVAEYRLKPLGVSFEEAVERTVVVSDWEPKGYEKTENGRPVGFATPTGKAEIYSVILEELGYDPLPKYREPPESPLSKPLLARKFQLILTSGGRFRPQFHSEYRQPGIGFREQHPYPLADIHQEVAREHGIANGDWIWIETPRGRCLQQARVSSAIHPKVVHIQHNWWYPEMAGQDPSLHGVFLSNANVLTLDDPDNLDPVSGSWQNRGLLCKVYKANEEDLQLLQGIFMGPK